MFSLNKERLTIVASKYVKTTGWNSALVSVSIQFRVPQSLICRLTSISRSSPRHLSSIFTPPYRHLPHHFIYHVACVIAGHTFADLCLIAIPSTFSYSDIMARKCKTAVFEMVALRGYGGSKARMMDIWKEERRIQLQAPNLIGRGRNGPSGGDRNRFLPLQLDYEQAQLGNQPDDEPYVRNDGIHWVDEIIGTTISQRRSRLSERQKLAQYWREIEKILSEAIYSRSERACECIHRDVVNISHITMEGYTWIDVPYCQCATSASSLIFSGFFPSSPKKPRTVFSLKLLRTLHEQFTRGSSSKEAQAGGLRAAFEADDKMVLPDFSCPVCPDIV